MTTDERTIYQLATATPPDLEALRAALDATDHKRRLAAIRSLGADDQRRLYAAAEDRPATIEQFVPPDTEPMREVIHDGQNTLPLFRSFQKRFCRPPDANSDADPGADSDYLWGYNEQTLGIFTGPGYFTAYESQATGETWIDYRNLPGDRPSNWPDIISNESRLGRFVYAGMVDRMRSLSRHVTIGRAFDGDTPTDNWFILVRRPV